MGNTYKERILKTINKPEFRSATVEEFKTILEIRNSKKERNLLNDLEALIKEGLIVKTNTNRYNSPENLGLKLAKVVRGSREFLFVEDTETKEEYFVPPGKTKQAFEDDLVYVSLKKGEQVENTDKRVAFVVSILKRENIQFVGTYKTEGDYAVVEISDKGNKRTLPVNKSDIAVEGHEVVVSVDGDGESQNWVVSKVLGHKNEPTTEILSILYNHGIKSEFNQETIEEANAIEEVIPEEEYYMRADLRNEMIVTIDGAEAKDLDDAVQLKINEAGNYVLGVHIADVSYYVTQHSALDDEAFERGTSVYLTDRVVPMLPPKLSNGICSLNPNTDRLTMSCEMEIDNQGNVVNYEIFSSVINSKCRFTYDEVNEIIHENNQQTLEKYKEFVPMVHDMEELRGILHKKRVNQGSINFETKEPKFIVDKDNKPLQIDVRERFEAEKLIEEFMLIANETVAKHFFDAKLPFVYRVHDIPKEEKVIQLSTILAKIGLEELYIEKYNSPKVIQKTLDALEGHPSEETIKTLALRMMSKAVYDSEQTGHFGLAKEFYTHFTSPIRRYPDLIVHRLIREFLLEHKISKKTRDFWTKELGKIAENSSRMERKAMEAERELMERKKAEFMADFIGNEFEGVISSITEYGFYIQLPNTVQGLVAIENLGGDFFFDEDTYSLRNRTTNETFKIGEKVNAKLVLSDKEAQKIEFTFVSRVEK